MRDALVSDKLVVVPQIIDENKDSPCDLTNCLGFMRMRRLRSIDELLSWPLNRFGIREPLHPPEAAYQDDAITNCRFFCRERTHLMLRLI